MIDVDQILSAFNRHHAEYLLIGGMNFLLRHKPYATFDTDLWIHDTGPNRFACEAALNELHASWGETEETWQPVSHFTPGWLGRQSVYSLLTEAGPLDLFLHVEGLPSWKEAAARADVLATPKGTNYHSLSDRDMLACQLALDESLQKLDRIRHLKGILEKRS